MNDMPTEPPMQRVYSTCREAAIFFNASNDKVPPSKSCLFDNLTILSQSSLHLLHASSKASNNLSYPLDLVKLRFELIDLLQYGSEACDFVIGHLYGIS